MKFQIFDKGYVFEPDNPFTSKGDWYPEEIDHYLGVKFIDEAECFHFGWIRCDVLDGGEKLVIKDYAYETQCDHPIIAGDTISYVGIENTNVLSNVNIYSFNHTIYVNVAEEIEISIYDLSGKLAFSEIVPVGFSSIKLDQPPGAYIVELVAGEKKFIKKVYLN